MQAGLKMAWDAIILSAVFLRPVCYHVSAVFLTGVRPSDASLMFSYVVLLGAQGCSVSSRSCGLTELHSFELAWLLVL